MTPSLVLRRLAAAAVLAAGAVALALPVPGYAETSPQAAPDAGPAAPAAGVPADIALLMEDLGIAPLMAVMQQEGQAYGEQIAADLFPGKGGAAWSAQVRGIYDPAHMTDVFAEAFVPALAGQDTGPIHAFFGSDLGKRTVKLELDARRALLDKAVEDAAALKFAQMVEKDDPRLRRLRELAEASDLIEMNVLGGLNANLAFYRGMIAGQAFPEAPDEEQLLSDVWSQEDAIREQTGDWLFSYMVLAYDPLSDADLAAYVRFAESPAGQALNQALFAGFDAVFADVSFRLGQAAARHVSGEDI